MKVIQIRLELLEQFHSHNNFPNNAISGSKKTSNKVVKLKDLDFDFSYLNPHQLRKQCGGQIFNSNFSHVQIQLFSITA